MEIMTKRYIVGQFWSIVYCSLRIIFADRTVLSYWHDNVVCPSVCDAVHCGLWLNDISYNKSVGRSEKEVPPRSTILQQF